VSTFSDNEGSRMVEPRRKRRRSPSDRRREARRLAERIETTSGERHIARAETRAADAHALDLVLHGTDAGKPLNRAISKRPDPYLISHGGLYEGKRALTGGGER
jgi:hypothetical protein